MIWHFGLYRPQLESYSALSGQHFPLHDSHGFVGRISPAQAQSINFLVAQNVYLLICELPQYIRIRPRDHRFELLQPFPQLCLDLQYFIYLLHHYSL